MTHEDHHRVSSLVTDLVEMANATKRLPEIEAELTAARDIILKDGATISRLELKLIDRSNEIDELKAKLRAAEVERDDAGFRQLEAEDKVARLADVHKSIRASVDDILKAAGLEAPVKVWEEPTAPAPESQAEAAQLPNGRATEDAEVSWATAPGDTLMYDEPKGAQPTSAPLSSWASDDAVSPGESVTDPTVSMTASEISESLPVQSQSVAERATAMPSTTEGQSDVPPTPDVASSPVGNSFGSASIGGVVSQGTAQPLASAKYAGKLYRSWPVYVSEADWLKGGGTSTSYWEGREQYRSAV